MNYSRISDSVVRQLQRCESCCDVEAMVEAMVEVINSLACVQRCMRLQCRWAVLHHRQ